MKDILRTIRLTLSDKGFIGTFLFACTMLVIFYGKLLMQLRNVYFGISGDGFQSYYTALYHVKHDQEFWRMEGMNYPYGEQVFFSGCQPFVTNLIKLLQPWIDLTGETVLIMNLFMLFSIVLSALALYLIFRHFKIQVLVAVIAAVSIAFLSPQIDRFSGHYSLTYQFAIPLLLLSLLKFDRKPTYAKSAWIGALTFFMAGTHFYFFAIFALVAAGYWGFAWLTSADRRAVFFRALKHGSIQVILPFVVIQCISWASDTVSDRSANPWGYMSYISNFQGIMFGTGRFYSPWLLGIFKPDFPAWEGIAYIGLVAVIVGFALLFRALVKLSRRQFKSVWQITDQPVLNAFFWTAFFALLLAFGFPFILGIFRPWLAHAGLLKQLRGIGRFAWVFYYVINIVVFYVIFQWITHKKRWVKIAVPTLALGLLFYDACIMNTGRQSHYLNRISALEDTHNRLPGNEWLRKIDPANYQAIIPLPYFHIGSENVWRFNGEEKLKNDVMVASLKTGLPLMAVSLSRTSLSQTFLNFAVTGEPYRPLEILKDFKNRKPLLVLVNEHSISKTETDFLRKCHKLEETSSFSVYEITLETLENISGDLLRNARAKLSSERTYPVQGFLSTDSTNTFIYEDFEDRKSGKTFAGNGSLQTVPMNRSMLFSGNLPASKEQHYTLSFWTSDFTADLYPRTMLEIKLFDSAGNLYKTHYYPFNKFFRVLDHNWALIEVAFQAENAGDRIEASIRNSYFTGKQSVIFIDELLIRPQSTSIYKQTKEKSGLWLNNRYYIE